MSKNGFKLTMAEFKGRVVESLDNIKDDIKEDRKLNREQHDAFFKRIRKLEQRPAFSIDPLGWFLTSLGFRR